MKLIPTRNQFKNWTLPSKCAFVAIILAIVIPLFILVINYFFGTTKQGQKTTHRKLDEAETDRQGKHEQALSVLNQVPTKTKELLEQKQLDRSKIFLGIRYAYEFDNYLGATNTFDNEDRKIDPDIPLRHKYNPNEDIKFVFLIANENEGLPFDSGILEVIWSDEILEVKAGRGWQEQYVNKRYTYNFSQINNKPLNANPIWVKFPRPGEYEFSCSIDGRSISTIFVPVKIELY